VDKTFMTPEVVIQLGWLAFLSIAIGIISIAVIGGIAFWKSENPAGSFTKLFERAQSLKMVTVLLIVLSVLILALLGKLDQSGAIGVLSGIAGYVLGGLEKGASDGSSGSTRSTDTSDKKALAGAQKDQKAAIDNSPKE